MDEGNLPLVVPIAALTDFFQCSICMCNMNSTIMTMCGHRFCDKCIREWVNRQHKCPCCNHVLRDDQLIKDHQFDSLLSTIEAEAEKAESKYFETLIDAAGQSEQMKDRIFSPVELIMKKHLKQGLVAHEKYFQSVKKSFQERLNTLETMTQKAIQELQTHGLSEQEVSLQTQDLNSSWTRQKLELKGELDNCAELVADAYDKYLSEHIPNLDVLPTKVSIRLVDKSITFPDNILQPTDTINQVRVNVESAMIKGHNPVHSWSEDVKMFLFGPFAKCSECEMKTIIDEYLTKGTLIPDVQLLTEGCMLGLQYCMKPGSNIVIHGKVICESDLPKKCFVETFKNGESGLKVDYFSCASCAFKWICRSCMEVCHQGHEVTPYIMQHQPAWACCYCPKKKKCVLQTTG